MPLAKGQILNNRYRIVKMLSQGGFGAVYRAWDLNLDRPFALKENLEQAPDAIRQFEREAGFLAGLHHPNLPRVIDCFWIEGQGQYMVMDFIDGEDLSELLEQAEGGLPETRVLSWITQICGALEYLHSQNPPIIHRDIKPANIKITPEDKAFLVDFGIAKAYQGSRKTTQGARAVTKGYSPPEQYGRGSTDARTDIYALGATLYTALTDEIPVESVQRHLGTDLIEPCQLNPAISATTEASIQKAMALDPQQRYQHASEFKADLLNQQIFPVITSVSVQKTAAAQVQSSSVALPDSQSRGGKTRSSWIVGGVVGFLLLFFCAAVFFSGMYDKPPLNITNTPIVTPRQATPTIKVTVTSQPNTPTEERAEPSGGGLPGQKTKTPTPIPHSQTPTATSTDEPTPTNRPTHTPTPTEQSGEWLPCANTYPSRLHVDDRAYVSYYPPLNNNVRSQPDADASKVGALKPGEEMKIVDGPSCADHMVWWKIRSLKTNLRGWTSEGDQEGYWLVPLP